MGRNLSYKEKYNILLQRQRKAENYLDNPKRTEIEVNKWLPEYKKILDNMNYCLSMIKDFTSVEVLNGFKF